MFRNIFCQQLTNNAPPNKSLDARRKQRLSFQHCLLSLSLRGGGFRPRQLNRSVATAARKREENMKASNLVSGCLIVITSLVVSCSQTTKDVTNTNLQSANTNLRSANSNSQSVISREDGLDKFIGDYSSNYSIQEGGRSTYSDFNRSTSMHRDTDGSIIFLPKLSGWFTRDEVDPNLIVIIKFDEEKKQYLLRRITWK